MGQQWCLRSHIVTLPKTETDGVYKATVDFTSCYFNILTQLGTDPNDYEAILPYRYGGGKVVINRDKAMTLTEQSFHIATPGTYDVTVDLRTMTMNLHSDTYVPEYPTVATSPIRAQSLHGTMWKASTRAM